jgi:hypothetical protein
MLTGGGSADAPEKRHARWLPEPATPRFSHVEIATVMRLCAQPPIAMKAQTLARNIALTSLGLGFAELLAPRQVARLIGISEDHERTLRALGLREIASGLGILQGKPALFLWSRVAGDVMDLALLAAAARSGQSNRRRVNAAIAAVSAITLLDVIASVLHSRSNIEPGWRDPRPLASRGGITRDDPLASRAACDAAMARQRAPHFVT